MNIFARALFVSVISISEFFSIISQSFIKCYDAICSKLVPFIGKRPVFEYVPNHLLLTGGLLTSQNRENYIKKLAQIIAQAYYLQIDQVTLYLGYSLWHVRDLLDLQNYLYKYLSDLQYKPLISIISGDETVTGIENNSSTDQVQSYVNPNLQFGDDELDVTASSNKTIMVAILAPNAKRSRLSSSSLLVQMLDKRVLDFDYADKVKKSQSVDSFLTQLPGYCNDVSGYFNRLIDCCINFGGDSDNSVQNVPFWFLRKALIFNTQSVANFEDNTLWRIIGQYSKSKSKKKIILKEE